jgi:hypothetical protein
LMRMKFLYAAYGWLLLSGILHFSIDVISQYLRQKRVPGREASLYYGLNTTYALGQVLVAILALFAIRQGVVAMGQWPGLVIAFGAALAWLAIDFLFLEYPQPKVVICIFAVLLIGSSLTT